MIVGTLGMVKEGLQRAVLLERVVKVEFCSCCNYCRGYSQLKMVNKVFFFFNCSLIFLQVKSQTPTL